jgi:nicotinamide mononucleotide adenylyltransferase
MASFCLMRAAPPHAGHAAVVRVMREHDAVGPWLVLIGSADVDSRADVPLSYADRRELLLSLLETLGLEAPLIAPLPELKTDGWDAKWAAYLLGAARAALGAEPTQYVFGSDYEASTFRDLVGVELIRVEREGDKSSRELRRAIVSGDAALLAKYSTEVATMSWAQRQRIVASCSRADARP